MVGDLSFWGKARRHRVSFILLFSSSSWLPACGASSAKHERFAAVSASSESDAASPPAGVSSDRAAAKRLIADVLDDWHKAASDADEERYFGHFAPDAVFMGTDATERWEVEAFRTYAHPHFAKGKAWSFRVVRRAVMVEGKLGWFDEDLTTPNLGPARGSGVMRHDGKTWRILHYNLTITVPNERFKEVKSLLEKPKTKAVSKEERGF